MEMNKAALPPYEIRVMLPGGPAIVAGSAWGNGRISWTIQQIEQDLRQIDGCKYEIRDTGTVAFTHLPSKQFEKRRCIELGRRLSFLRCMQIALAYVEKGAGPEASRCLLDAMSAETMMETHLDGHAVPEALPDEFRQFCISHGCKPEANYRVNNIGYILHVTAVRLVALGYSRHDAAKVLCRKLGIERDGKTWQRYIAQWKAYAQGVKSTNERNGHLEADKWVLPPSRGRPSRG